jgi:quinol-cytochrome oxidoreductase complex cytochrome b subunit
MPAHVGPLEGEELGLLIISFGFLAWCLVPWIDRGRHPLITKIVMAAGVAILVFLTFMTYLGHSA